MGELGFWKERWDQEKIGFHRETVHPMLEKYLERWAEKQRARVFVPLAGKSFDLRFLAERGFDVFGVEWVESAVLSFFSEQNLACEREESDFWAREMSLHLRVGDVFAQQSEDLGDCQFVYDRAAFIALDAEKRQRYAEMMCEKLPSGCRMFLIALDYADTGFEGPPFSVDAKELESLYAKSFSIEKLQRETATLRPAGLAEGANLYESAYLLIKK